MSTLELRLVDGNRIVVPRSLDELTTCVVLEQEDWFEDEIRFVRRLLEPGMRAVDVGANHGVYTLAMAAAVGPAGRVWAFEPASGPRELLARSLERNAHERVTLSDAALSHYDGDGRMSGGAGSELAHLTASAGAEGQRVRVTRLDRAARDLGIENVDLIKLDAEGEEQAILEGGSEFLAAESPLVLFEIQQDSGFNTALVRRFREIGYGVYRLLPGPALLVPVDEGQPLDPFQLNLFACKPDRAVALQTAGLLASDNDTGADRCDGVSNPESDSAPRLPFARALAPAWARESPCAAALALRSVAHDALRPAAERRRALRDCLTGLETLVAERPTFPRLSGLARALVESGRRRDALDTVRRLAETVHRGNVTLDEPFVPANPRFDDLDPAPAVADWVVVGLVEQLDRLATHSSFFSGVAGLERIEEMRTRRFYGVEMERRRQLRRMRAGCQDGPEAHPLVAESTPEHRNAAYWRGEA